MPHARATLARCYLTEFFFVDVAHGFFGEEALFSVVADGLRETIKSAFVGLQPGENMTLS